MAFKNFKVETDADGIALGTWDIPARAMNVVDDTKMSELEEIVKQTSADAGVKGFVVTSGKEAFSAGADLSMLEGMNHRYTELLKAKGEVAANQMLFDESRKSSLVFRAIETSGKPWVAAINGHAPGPGLVPPRDEMQVRLKGEAVNLEKAKALKLIDAVVPAGDLIKAAKDWIKGGGKAVAPWDEKGFKLPGGPIYSKAGMMMFPAGNAIYRRETYDNYPAARAVMSCVYEGLQLPIDAALRVACAYLPQILRSKEAAAMIRSLFLSMQELNKGARRPPNLRPTQGR